MSPEARALIAVPILTIIIGLTAGLVLRVHFSTTTAPGEQGGRRSPSIVPGPLDGLPTPRRIALRRPVAAMFDNFNPDARPQSGIGEASVVYETLAEGGITRLMGVFLEHDASSLGPLRSARTYFVQWAAAYRPLFVHAGGAPAALQLLYRTPQIANVEALLPEPEFRRVTDRPAPHNLYGSTYGAREIARRNRWDIAGHFPWLLHRRASPVSGRAAAQTIHIAFSTAAIGAPPGYAVTYRYDRATNRYLRFVGGWPSLDRLTGRQVAPANVAVLFTSIRPIPNDPEQRIDVRVTGTGRALYFREGHAIPGRWSKRSLLAPLRFSADDGLRIAFDPGPTWIEVVPPGDAVYDLIR